jgi:hypothetical protein
LFNTNSRAAKPTQLFAHKDGIETNTDESDNEHTSTTTPANDSQNQQLKMEVDNENPF